MKTSVKNDTLLNEALALIEETRFRAKLSDRPYVLGLLVENERGTLAKVLRSYEDELQAKGAVRLEWRDDGLRGRAKIGSEELLVSVQRA